jgi:AcrR family transcriptional regulator
MLDTALGSLSETGLRMSIDTISFEDVIRESGVSRAAAFRLWPSRDLFTGELVLEMARLAIPADPGGTIEGSELIRGVLVDRLGELATPEGQWTLVLDLLRDVSAADFDLTSGADSLWRTYLALHITVDSMPPGELRTQIKEAVDAAQAATIQRIAGTYGRFATLLGLRLKRPDEFGVGKLAELMLALIRGLALSARLGADDGDAVRVAAAHLPDLGAEALMAAAYEPDPDVVWDEARIAALRDYLITTKDLVTGASSG